APSNHRMAVLGLDLLMRSRAQRAQAEVTARGHRNSACDRHDERNCQPQRWTPSHGYQLSQDTNRVSTPRPRESFFQGTERTFVRTGIHLWCRALPNTIEPPKWVSHMKPAVFDAIGRQDGLPEQDRQLCVVTDDLLYALEQRASTSVVGALSDLVEQRLDPY